MSHEELRQAYLRWTGRAALTFALPLVLTAALQGASAAAWWENGPDAGLGVRSLFVAVGAAAIAFGRSKRAQETASKCTVARLTSLSWQLLVLALAPVVLGAVLAFMTRSLYDFYLLLVITLVGLGMLYPRFEQWLAWAAVADAPANAPADARDDTPATPADVPTAPADARDDIASPR